MILASLAGCLMRTSDTEAAVRTAQRAVAAARAAGTAPQEADASITLGVARAYLGSADEGLAALRDGLRLALDLAAPTTALRGYVNLSDVLEYLGRHAEAAQVAEEGIALASRVGMARTLGSYLTGNLVEPLLRLGRWPDVERLTAQALSALPEGVFAATLRQLRAEMAAMSGRYADAATELRAARRALGQTNDSQFTQTVRYADALAAHGRGDLAAARDMVSTGLADGAGQWSVRYVWPLLWLGLRLEADEVTRAHDRREPMPAAVGERRRELTRLARDTPAPTPPLRGYQALAAAETARAEGRAGPAAWSAALAAWRTAGEPYPLAYALLRLAEVHCAAGDRQLAAPAVQEASAIALRLGAAPLAADAAALARRARLSLDQPSPDQPSPAQPSPDQPSPDQPSPGHAATAEPAHRPAGESPDAPATAPTDVLARFGLTDREREVLLLLADGRSNPGIAQTLFISPKTASVHVSNILAKLGVTGRVEAAAVAHRLGAVGQAPPGN